MITSRSAWDAQNIHLLELLTISVNDNMLLQYEARKMNEDQRETKCLRQGSDQAWVIHMLLLLLLRMLVLLLKNGLLHYGLLF